MAKALRWVADCRKIPSKKKCTLTIAGKLNEVLPLAMDHAVKSHGHKRSPKLKTEIRKSLKKAR